jgi:xylulokinase
MTIPSDYSEHDKTLLCVDFGTSAIKAGLVRFDGVPTRFEYERLPAVAHNADGFTAGLWMTHFARLMARMPDRGTISGVIISGNGPTIVAVDARGDALEPVMLWFDGRDNRIADETSFFLPKVSWFADRHPEILAQTRWFLSCPEYISFRLTGEACTVTPSDEFAPFIWSADGIARYQLDALKFPPFVRCGDRIGRVTTQAAQLLSIPQGVPVIAGGSDFLMSLVGTASVLPGRTCDRAGTSEGINHCTDVIVTDSRLRCLPHVVPGRYNVAGILSSTGRIFEWFREISGQTAVEYAQMLAQITQLPDDRHIPWFFPSIHQGATWEFSRGMFIELGAQHGVAEMGRAVVESIGFAVRESVEILEQSGCVISELRVSGGQAKNALWNQMKSDMIGKPVLVGQIADAEIIGNACAGLVGLGYYGSLVEASQALYRQSACFEPDMQRYQHHAESFNRYRQAYAAFRHALADSISL